MNSAKYGVAAPDPVVTPLSSLGNRMRLLFGSFFFDFQTGKLRFVEFLAVLFFLQ